MVVGVPGIRHMFYIHPKYVHMKWPDFNERQIAVALFKNFTCVQWDFEDYRVLSITDITDREGNELIARILNHSEKIFVGHSQKVCLMNSQKQMKMVDTEYFKLFMQDDEHITFIDPVQFVIDCYPEDKWDDLFAALNGESIRPPKTYLLRWNPAISSFKIEHYLDAIKNYPEGFCTNWSVYEWEDAHKGDRFYMVRVGDGNTGVVYLGEFLSEPYEGEDWAGMGKKRYYVDIDCMYATHPDERPLLTTEELQAAIPEIDWTKGHSGQLLTDEQAEKLNNLWFSRID